MAITIDILEDEITIVNETIPVRTVNYTARGTNGDGDGTMYYAISTESAPGVPLTPSDVLTPPSTAIAQYLLSVAVTNGQAIPDLVTDVYIEKRRVQVYLETWQILKNELGDTGVTLTQFLNHMLAKLAENQGLTTAFKADAWREGLIALPTDNIPSMGGLPNDAARRIWYKQIKMFFLGLTVGIAGNFILDDYLEQAT